jgi:hypothetical protein
MSDESGSAGYVETAPLSITPKSRSPTFLCGPGLSGITKFSALNSLRVNTRLVQYPGRTP